MSIPALVRRARSLARQPLLRWPLIGLTYASVFLALHPGLWDGVRFLGWDAVREHWGALVYGSRLLWSGDLPLWCPHERAGYAFLADPQTAVTYPINLPFFLASRLFGAGPNLILLHTLVHLAIAATGVHFYLQRLKLPAPASWFGGLSYVLCARVAKTKDQSTLWSGAWLPWLLIAADEFGRRPSRRSGATLGLVTAVSFLAGYPPNFFRNMLAALPILLLAGWSALRSAPCWRAHLRRLAWAATIAITVTIGLSLANVLGTAALFDQTQRVRLSLAESMHSSLHLEHLVQLFGPGLIKPTQYGFPYMGLAAAVLALVGATWRVNRQRLLWLALAVLFYLLACGSNTFLLPLLARLFPPFGLFRVAEQYLLVAAFFLAVLAARGLGDVLDVDGAHQRGLRRVLLAIAGLAVAVGLAAYLVAHLAPQRVDPVLVRHPAAIFVFAVLTGALLLALVTLPRSRRHQLVWLLLVLLVVDLGVQLRPVYDILERKPSPERERRDLPRLKGIDWDARLADDGYFGYRVGQRLHIRELFGRQNTLVTRRFKAYAAQAANSYALLAAANVRYYAGRHARAIRAQAPHLVRELSPSIIELERYAPVGAWTARVELLPHEENVLRQMKRGAAAETALFAESDLSSKQQAQLRRLAAAAPSVARPVAGHLLRFDHNELTLQIDAPARGVLVVNEAYAPGWRATVDGTPAEILPVNFLFRGVIVQGGHHVVTLHYRPTAVLAGLGLYALTALSLLILPVVGWVGRRRRTGGRS